VGGEGTGASWCASGGGAIIGAGMLFGVGELFAISMSVGLWRERSGALNMRRFAITLPIRRPIEPRGPGGDVCGWDDDRGLGCAPRARIRLMWRSRRTIMFVIGTGHAPGGNTLCLHIGQSEELRSRNVSIQSGWNIWRHGSSRTCVSFASKSSRQMGHVG
jgi:hypothetical protein